jgi:hypothetical protein
MTLSPKSEKRKKYRTRGAKVGKYAAGRAREFNGVQYRLWDIYYTKLSAELAAGRLKRPGAKTHITSEWAGGDEYWFVWVHFHPKSKLTGTTGRKRLR